MRKASKLLLNISGLTSIISVFSSVIVSFLALVIFVFSGAYIGRTFLVGTRSTLHFHFFVASEYGLAIGATVLASIFIVSVIFIIAAVLAFRGVKGSKKTNIANIVLGCFGFLPAVALGLLLSILILIMLGGLAIFLYETYYVITTDRPASNMIYWLISLTVALIGCETLVGFFAISGIMSICFGLLFGFTSILGGTFGLIALRKENRQLEEVHSDEKSE